MKDYVSYDSLECKQIHGNRAEGWFTQGRSPLGNGELQLMSSDLSQGDNILELATGHQYHTMSSVCYNTKVYDCVIMIR